jgi:hypothetical protein
MGFFVVYVRDALVGEVDGNVLFWVGIGHAHLQITCASKLTSITTWIKPKRNT